MNKKCAIVPLIKDKNGVIKDSELYKDLLEFSPSRSEATRVYHITKENDFITSWYSKLDINDQNEPTFKSLLDKTNLSDFIKQEDIINKLNRDIGHFKKGQDRLALWPLTDESYNILFKKVLNFNKNSLFKDLFVAGITKIDDLESHRLFYNPYISPRTKLASLNADKTEYNFLLNEKLKLILSSYGISIGALTALEEREAVSGVTDFDVAETTTNGIIELIRLAKGERGEKALPEEFSHFAIEALGYDHPLISRLLNLIKSENLVKEILGDEYAEYAIRYKNDKTLLIKEALGKLVAKQLLKQEVIENKPYKNLLNRVVEAIKNFFKKLDASKFLSAIITYDKYAGEIASKLLSGELSSDIKIENIKNAQGKLYDLGSRVKRDLAILLKAIDNTAKRIKIYENLNPDSKAGSAERIKLDTMKAHLIENEELEGIAFFCEDAIENLKLLTSDLELLRSDESVTINEKAKKLREIHNFVFSYSEINDELKASLRKEQRESDNRYTDKMSEYLDLISKDIEGLLMDYNELSLPLWVDYLKPFLGDKITVTIEGEKRVLTKEDLEKLQGVRDGDISLKNAWLDAVADTPDIILKMIDLIIKKVKETKRHRVIELSQKIMSIGEKARQAGIKSFDWIYEKNSNGEYGYNLISEINTTQYKEDKDAFLKEINEKYGTAPEGEQAELRTKEIKEWFNIHRVETNGIKLPNPAYYANKEFLNLSSAQKEFYNLILEIFNELLRLIPEKYYLDSPMQAPLITKDLIERIASSGGLKGGLQETLKSLKDLVMVRPDDDEFGSARGITNFEGKEVNSLPIYFTRKLDKPSDLSHDIISTMIAYADMAINYDEMSNVVNILELGKDLLLNRDILKTSGGKPVYEKFQVAGHKVSNRVNKGKADSNFHALLESMFNTQIYQRYMKDEGKVLGVSTAKLVNVINKVSAINDLGFNPLGVAAAVVSDIMQVNIEVAGGLHFNGKNLVNADKNWAAGVVQAMDEVGKPIKTNKIDLFFEYFKVLPDESRKHKEVEWLKSKMRKFFSSNTLFFLYHAGEYWGFGRVALALADAYKMKAPDGTIVGLYDAFEVKFLDENNKKLGAKLQLKEGYTKEDGSKFTLEDTFKLTRKIAGLNRQLFVNSTLEDRVAIQQLALGRLAMLYRNFLTVLLNRRYLKATYNMDLGQMTEGYYRSTGRFLLLLLKDLKQGKLLIATQFRNLTKEEQANFWKALTESAVWLSLTILLGITGSKGDPDDNPWFTKLLLYHAYRLKTELGAQVPSVGILLDTWKMLKSPFGGMRTIDNLTNLIGVVSPFNYKEINPDAEIKQGRYKGHSKAYKDLMESPFFPGNRAMYRFLHPEEAILFYK